MSDELELEAIERRIAVAQNEGTEAADGRLQRLYIERERVQERQFKRSIARRAKANEGKR